MEIEAVEIFLKTSRTSGFYADRMRATAKCDDLELFWVDNTANSRQFVIASKPKYAKIISSTSGHIREEKNGRAFRANETFFANNPGFGSAVKRAIRDRQPGVLVRKGEHACMGDRVYSPIHEVPK